jgi:hypothetical protein
MKTTFFSIGVFASLAAANINFEWVQPTCDIAAVDAFQCLTGQHCTEGNTLVSAQPDAINQS